MIGTVGEHATLMRLAWHIEGHFKDCDDGTDVGEGIHETRPEYRRDWKHVNVVRHEDGRCALVTLDKAGEAYRVAVIAELADKIAPAADVEAKAAEVAIVAAAVDAKEMAAAEVAEVAVAVESIEADPPKYEPPTDEDKDAAVLALPEPETLDESWERSPVNVDIK